MFGPPTTTLRCQPIFAASTDCVSIADRQIVCVMCTQLHSYWRTMDGWWFQWLRWLVLSVRGQDWELFAVCGCVHARRRVILSPSCLISIQFFLVCSMLIIKALSAVKWGHGCVPVRLCRFLQETLLPLLWRDWPGIYVVVWLIEYDFQFRLVVMMIPRNTFSDCVSLVFGFLPLVSIAAGLNVQGCSCGTDHVIRSHSIYLDFDGVTLWFCIVSMCSSLPLASS